MATMYYWSKYINNVVDKYRHDGWNPQQTVHISNTKNISESFTFNEDTGRYFPSGALDYPKAGRYFAIGDATIYKIILLGPLQTGSYVNSQAQTAITTKYLADQMGALQQNGIVATDDAYPTNGKHTDGFWYVRGALANAIPTITLNTSNNSTLYENDTFKIDGSAVDPDVGNIVNVKYQINSEAIRAIAVNISTGAAMPYNKQLLFKAGILHDDATAVTGPLNAGVAHTLKVWAEDDQGGKSAEQIRTFYVVPNRPPALTVDAFTEQSDMINNDTIILSGVSSDPDGNDVKVAYKLNSNAAVQIHSGVAGPWTFDLSLKSLKDGENIIVVEVTDTYDFKTSKTIKLNKTANPTPLASSVQRYKIVPPSGSAQGVLLWIQRDKDQEVSAEISMTTGIEQEQFVPLTLENTAPVGESAEDYFKFRADTPAEHIALKLSWTGNKPITLISGALLQ